MPGGIGQWIILLSLGFYGGFGHWLLIKAYREATTAALAPYPYLQMVWMIFFGYVIFDQFPDRYTLDGRRDHRGQRALYRAPRTSAAPEEPHGSEHRRRGAGEKALISMPAMA